MNSMGLNFKIPGPLAFGLSFQSLFGSGDSYSIMKALTVNFAIVSVDGPSFF